MDAPPTPPGLYKAVDQLASVLGGPPTEPASALAEAVEAHRGRYADWLGKRGLAEDELPTAVRHRLGWLRLFAAPEWVQCYRDSVARLRAALRTHGLIILQDRPLRFQPQRPLFRGTQRGRRLDGLGLKTPILAFTAVEWRALAGLVAGERAQRPTVLQALQGPACQSLHTRLLGPAPDRTAARGQVYDLGRLFDRLNHEYFAGRMTRPGLAWSRHGGRRQVGSYDPIEDRVQISRRLDAPDVPVYVPSFVLYHELLHKWHGIEWSGPRGRVHTAAFRADERRFPAHRAAERYLARLARSR